MMPFECKKYHCKCEARCCGIVPIPVSTWQNNQHNLQQEIKEKRKAYATNKGGDRKTVIIPITENGLCPFLRRDLACAIYKDRPEICRRFGDETDILLCCPMQHADGIPRSDENAIEIGTKVRDRMNDK